MKNKSRKFLLIWLLLIIAILAFIFTFFYITGGKITLPKNQKTAYLYIPTNSTFQDVCDSLAENRFLSNLMPFKVIAKHIEYNTHVRAGRYELKQNQNIVSVLRMLKNGNQKPIRLVLKKSRTKEEFAGKITRHLETDSLTFLNLLYDSAFLKKYELNPETALSLFLQNTYEIFWNTSPTTFFDKMAKENRRFWNDDRLRKAQNMRLSPIEVYILASIVDEETNKKSEKPTVSSVYMNRLRKGMRLQADPTSRFAARAFEVKRITGDIQITDSPYNTYKHAGLPPGPICIPEVNSIDAVLENKQTDFIFFCAKEDFSGYHNFAVTYSEHLKNRDRYLKELNKRGF